MYDKSKFCMTRNAEGCDAVQQSLSEKKNDVSTAALHIVDHSICYYRLYHVDYMVHLLVSILYDSVVS